MALRRDTLLRRAAEAKRASKRVALRDGRADAEELAVDLAALANSGGGVLVLGPGAELDRQRLRELVPELDGLDLEQVKRDGRPATAILVDAATEAPIAVGRHAYFRHGGRSEPATARDLTDFLERRLGLIRRQWLRSIREVLTAREGAHVAVVETEERDEHGVPTLVRLSTDPGAPLYGRLDPDRTHPYRQTEVVSELNRHLPEGVSVTPYDILSVRRVHGIAEESQPEFTHVPKFGSPQYSDAFVDWLLARHAADQDFFAAAKAEYTKSVRRRRGRG